jgi:hypothetical protein
MSLYLAKCNEAEIKLASGGKYNAFMTHLWPQLTSSFVDLSGKMTPNYHTMAMQGASPAVWVSQLILLVSPK